MHAKTAKTLIIFYDRELLNCIIKNVTEKRKNLGRCIITNVTELKRGHFYEGAKHGHLLSKFIETLQDGE